MTPRSPIRLTTMSLAALMATVAQPAFAQRAGTLIAAERVGDAPPGMNAWRVRYWSADQRRRPIQVTGMVIAPAVRSDRPDRRTRPVIAWTHGLIGIAQRCGPSLGASNFSVIPALGDAIGRGYTIVAPDYPGLGSDMVHPVLVGDSEARSVLDAVRAARGIPEAAAGSRFAVWGESQGGHAALWTGQLWQGYAPDLQLLGIAAMVPPTDLARNFREGSDPRVRALLTAYAGTSWSRYYSAPMTVFGSKSVQGVMTRLADNNCVQFDARPRIGTIVGIVIVQRAIRNLDLSTRPTWGALMRTNSPSPAAIPTPALIATGTGDTIVAPAVVRDFARRACTRGKTIRFVSVQGGDHVSVSRTQAKATLDWIDARFAGRPAPNDCGKI